MKKNLSLDFFFTTASEEQIGYEGSSVQVKIGYRAWKWTERAEKKSYLTLEALKQDTKEKLVIVT